MTAISQWFIVSVGKLLSALNHLRQGLLGILHTMRLSEHNSKLSKPSIAINRRLVTLLPSIAPPEDTLHGNITSVIKSTDTLIESKVLEILTAELKKDARMHRIRVEVGMGCVRLFGVCKTYFIKSMAISTVMRVIASCESKISVKEEILVESNLSSLCNPRIMGSHQPSEIDHDHVPAPTEEQHPAPSSG